MTDIEQPAEEPVAPDELPPAPPAPAGPETLETPAQAPETVTVWVALTRVRYEDAAGNEFFCGPGETIPAEHVDQLEADSVSEG